MLLSSVLCLELYSQLQVYGPELDKTAPRATFGVLLNLVSCHRKSTGKFADYASQKTRCTESNTSQKRLRVKRNEKQQTVSNTCLSMDRMLIHDGFIVELLDCRMDG